jgi:hypothetical protein
MPDRSRLSDFEHKDRSFKNVSGDGTTAADTDLAVVEVDYLSHVTGLEISSASEHIYDLVVRDTDGQNPTVRKTVHGNDIDQGNFLEPALENIGASQEVALINREQLADENIAIYLKVHTLDADSVA